MQNRCILRGNKNHSSLTTTGMLSSMPISGNHLKDTNPPPSVNTSPIGASTSLDEDSSMETILETQEFMQTSNPRRRAIGTKRAKELIEVSTQEGRELNEVMKSYKYEILERKELKIMLKDASTILTLVRR
ncbi:hypothetical protein Pyn_23274 [Prunus yedoensis var. nudiflora]|uniref:Uncharacterized protein n=1 Tax=Prunus yedoensis var. nudiflora TaxID=2094558 RepID=A0A314YPL9_PRUYE|nr:hypothetical protein Pyn_23274 [Prunus yedoensis var. nudiflora]